MKIPLILADENFFISLYFSNLSLNILDNIEKNLGIFLLTNEEFENITKKTSKYMSSINQILWNTSLSRYNQNYNNILIEISNNKKIKVELVYNIINELTMLIHKIIKQHCAGISIQDAKIYAISYYLRRNTNYEPIIVSDDSDINLHGNFISSYFGLALIELSIFELIRIYNEKELIENYAHYKKIDRLKIYEMSHKLKKNQYEPEIKKLFSKGLLKTHPKIMNDREYNILIKK
jgi:hypothetical protein